MPRVDTPLPMEVQQGGEPGGVKEGAITVQYELQVLQVSQSRNQQATAEQEEEDGDGERTPMSAEQLMQLQEAARRTEEWARASAASVAASAAENPAPAVAENPLYEVAGGGQAQAEELALAQQQAQRARQEALQQARGAGAAAHFSPPPPYYNAPYPGQTHAVPGYPVSQGQWQQPQHFQSAYSEFCHLMSEGGRNTATPYLDHDQDAPTFTTCDLIRIGAAAAREALQEGNTVTVEIGTSDDDVDALFETRKKISFKVAVAHVRKNEREKCGSALAGMCQLESEDVQYLHSRYDSDRRERLGRKIDPKKKGPKPKVVTAMYKVRFEADFCLLTSIDQFREAVTYREYNAIMTAIEAGLKGKMQLECLGSYAREKDRVRLDYRSFRHESPNIVYAKRPKRNKNFQDDPKDDPMIVGYDELSGIDWSSKCRRSQQGSMHDCFQD